MHNLLEKKEWDVPDGGDWVYGLVFEALLEPHGMPLPD